jgi:DNA-binding protein H-NS
MLAKDVNDGRVAHFLPPEGNDTNSHIDQSSLVNALLAAKDQLIEELKEKYDKMEAEKDARIADLTKLAEERLHRIAELRRVIDANEINPSNYPFPVGVADTQKQKRI